MIYFDSSATSIKPDYVLQSVLNYSKNYNANVGRGNCTLSQKATEQYELSRKYVANFLNAKSEKEIIFTSGTTASINLLANALCKSYEAPKRNKIVISETDHNSSIVVFQQYCIDTKKKELVVIPVQQNGILDYSFLETLLKKSGHNIYLMSLTHVSNATGVINDIKRVIDLCHNYDIMVSVDMAQSIPHLDIDVQALDVDFISFSGHKIYSPFGIGILYGKEIYLEKLHPATYGGGMVSAVSIKETEFKTHPYRFESGTQNLSGVAGLHAGLKWFSEINGKQKIFTKEDALYKYTVNKIQSLPDFRIIGTPEKATSIISIVHKTIPSSEIAKILDQNNICARNGWLCSHLLMEKLNLKDGVTRISLSFENTQQEIDYLIDVLKKIK